MTDETNARDDARTDHHHADPTHYCTYCGATLPADRAAVDAAGRPASFCDTDCEANWNIDATTTVSAAGTARRSIPDAE